MTEHLQPRLISGMEAQYEVADWPGENTSGLEVYGKRVLVKMDVCSKASAGGVLLTDDAREKMDFASTTGTIYAVAGSAFLFNDDGTKWSGVKPQPGARVYTEKYAGIVAKGKDGSLYRIMDEGCIAAGLAPEEIGETEDTAGRVA
jgi:co-chaperonin GroES (HSP10)